MRIITKTAIALGFVAAMAIGGTAPAEAFHVWIGHHHHHYWGGGPRYYNYYGGGYGGGNCYRGGCCPQGMTIQGGACRPYRGPYGW